MTKEKFNELALIGAQMANICFNLGQHHHEGEPIVVDVRTQKSMRDLDRQWHDKLQEIRKTAAPRQRVGKH